MSAPETKCIIPPRSEVNGCDCDEKLLDTFNNGDLHERLIALLHRPYFRFFKVNLDRKCPFWNDYSDKCSIPDCAVKTCAADELPISLRDLSVSNVQAQVAEACAQEEELSSVDYSMNADQKAEIVKWEDLQDENFCLVDDEGASDCSYLDLSKNPERYTGYVGFSPNRIWRSIYEENCFKPSNGSPTFSLAQAMQYETCFEKKAFFRVISGLHSSISIHLCALYLPPGPFGQWGPNLQEFLRRFDDSVTDGEGSDRLRNLYFTYSLLLRALVKASPRLKNEKYSTGDVLEDETLRKDVQAFLDIIAVNPSKFDESKLFSGEPAQAHALKEEFRLHFRNISRIMDCVGCQKCRLWGKLQTQGIGTALKILFSDLQTIDDLKLLRSEIVSLWQAFGRISSSLVKLAQFRSMIQAGSARGGGDMGSNVPLFQSKPSVMLLSTPSAKKMEL
ncbi:ERO1-like protein alpha [Hypsibius exemplaris]|uniref:ERO1-like protein alpha n=1 Tax=Hypsibius exemplaris TaxID=2072580 RepID=A0A1W0X734_HYPEX|nr:ERO1-like protein alpha [Hypsibius exemplaris]